MRSLSVQYTAHQDMPLELRNFGYILIVEGNFNAKHTHWGPD